MNKFTLFVYCNFLVLLSTTVYIQNINKQNVNIADETLTDYSFLGRYHYTKFQKEYWRRLNKENIWYWIVKFCPFVLYVYGFGRTFLNMVSLTTWTLIWTSSISCRLWRQMSYSSLSDNGMLQIFSFLIKWLYGAL